MRAVSGFACIAACVAALPAMAEVRVQFVNPQSFTDAGLYAPRPANADSPALIGLRRILERVGQGLPASQDLVIEILDVDLAGYFPPWQRSGTPIRVMETTTWPRITLRWSLKESDSSLAHGEQVLTDMSYLTRPAVFRSTAPLRFEEAMLRDWFDLTPTFHRR
jgi:hypothetical protein